MGACRIWKDLNVIVDGIGRDFARCAKTISRWWWDLTGWWWIDLCFIFRFGAHSTVTEYSSSYIDYQIIFGADRSCGRISMVTNKSITMGISCLSYHRECIENDISQYSTVTTWNIHAWSPWNIWQIAGQGVMNFIINCLKLCYTIEENSWRYRI